MTANSPLGMNSDYPQQYSPEQLFGIARAETRAELGLNRDLPFSGEDIWNAWELTWLDQGGMPQIACAELRIPADSTNIVESKSLKLYLGSFTMSRFDSVAAVTAALQNDIGSCCGAKIKVRLFRPDEMAGTRYERLEGDTLDDRAVSCDAWEVNAALLQADRNTVTGESLHSNLLRSLCPVTGQPDCGSILIKYRGARIDRDSLLRYIVSYRQHADFHENCVERIFVEIMHRCAPTELTVYARYQRRGGIDINPFRSNFESSAANIRLWQQ
jgi:7-cyano-7-deazaguanine reductase